MEIVLLMLARQNRMRIRERKNISTNLIFISNKILMELFNSSVHFVVNLAMLKRRHYIVEYDERTRT